MCCSKATPSQSGPHLSLWDGKSASKPLPLFWHLCFQYFTRKILCALDLNVSVSHLFSIFCRIARKIFRTKELQVKYSEIRTYPMRTSSLDRSENALQNTKVTANSQNG